MFIKSIVLSIFIKYKKDNSLKKDNSKKNKRSGIFIQIISTMVSFEKDINEIKEDGIDTCLNDEHF